MGYSDSWQSGMEEKRIGREDEARRVRREGKPLKRMRARSEQGSSKGTEDELQSDWGALQPFGRVYNRFRRSTSAARNASSAAVFVVGRRRSSERDGERRNGRRRARLG